MKSWLRLGQLALTGYKSKPGAGYTITEVLVVLAVTMAMFAAISVTLRGRTERTQFTHAVRDYEARLQSVITDVSNGNYASDSADPGGDPNRIFLGMMIATDAQANEVLTIQGKRSITNVVGSDVQTLAEADPEAIVGVNSLFANSFGMEIDQVVRIGSGVEVAVFGFLNRLGGSSLVGENSLIQLHGIPGTTVPTSRTAAASAIATPGSLVPIPEGILICLRGGNDQIARITVGANNSQTGIFSEILEEGDACT